MLNNKKGFLLAEETLKIVIAVICLGFLAYLLGSLYFSNIEAQKMEQARQILTASKESLSSVIANLNDGESENFLLENPVGWYLFSFTENEEKPNSCAGNDCICICDNVYFGEYIDRQVNECSEGGACIPVEGINNFENIEIKNPQEGLTEILIQKEEGKIKITGPEEIKLTVGKNVTV